MQWKSVCAMPYTSLTFDSSSEEWEATVAYLQAVAENTDDADSSLPVWIDDPQLKLRFKRRLGLIGRKATKLKWDTERNMVVEVSDRISRQFIPRFDTGLRDSIISNLHVSLNHPSYNPLFGVIRRSYANITEDDVQKFVNECTVCIQNGAARSDRRDLHPVLSAAPNDHWQMDLVDMRRYAGANDGFGWILCVIDLFSKYLWTFPLLAKEPDFVNVCLFQLFECCGIPKVLQSDNGGEFDNDASNALMKKLRIEYRHGAPGKWLRGEMQNS